MKRHIVPRGQGKIPPIGPRRSADVPCVRHDDGASGAQAPEQDHTTHTTATIQDPVVQLSAEAIRENLAAHRIPDLMGNGDVNVIRVPLAGMWGWVARIDYGNHDPSRIARVEHPIVGRSSNSASLPREPVKDYEADHGRSAGSWRYEVARTCFDKNTELPSPDYDMNEPPSNWNWRMSSTYLDDILLQASSEILNRVHTTPSKRVSWYDEANNNIGELILRR